MQLNGTIKLIGNTEEVGNNGFTKRQTVITTKEQYPQDIAVDFVKEKTSLLDNFSIGQEVNVSINLRGNEYKGKYYVNIQGWKIEAVQGQGNTNQPFEPATNLNEEDHDDLPF